MKVVTLIPPAVDVLPPPISMRQMNSSDVLSCRAAMSTVLNPAVRVVTPWNQLTTSLSPMPSNRPSVPGLLHSRAAKAATDQKISAAVPTSISLECSVSMRQRRTRARSAKHDIADPADDEEQRGRRD